MNKNRGATGPTPIGDIVPSGLFKEIKGPSLIQQRLIEGAVLQIENPDEPRGILYQHSVLYQTCLPFCDPGD